MSIHEVGGSEVTMVPGSSFQKRKTLKKKSEFVTLRMYIVFFYLLFHSVYADVRTAQPGTILWSDSNSWIPSGIPSSGDTVIISKGSDVIFDSATPRYSKLLFF